MKLWIFVLLGLLAQTSQGCFQIQNYAIEQHITDRTQQCFNTLNGLALNIPFLGKQIVATYTKIDLSVSCKNNGGGQYTVIVTGKASISCPGFKDIIVGVSITVNINQDIKGGNFFWAIEENSLEITLDASKITFSNPLLSGGAFQAALTLVIKETLKGLVGTITGTLNTELSRLTNPFEIAGQKFHCKPDKMESTDTSTSCWLTVVRDLTGQETSFSDENGNYALPDRWSSGLFISQDTLPFVFPANFETFSYGADYSVLNEYGLFTGVPGIEIQVKISGSRCEITRLGSVLYLFFYVSFSDGQNVYLEFKVEAKFAITFSGKDGILSIIVDSQIQITSTELLSAPHPSCGCGDDVLDTIADYINGIIGKSSDSAATKFASISFPYGSLIPYDSGPWSFSTGDGYLCFGK